MGVSAATLFVDIGASLKPLDDALGKMQKAFDSAGKNMRSVGQNLSTYVTAPIVLATGLAVKFSVDFNKSMANVASLIPGNTERVEELKRAVQDLALETGLSTDDIASGLYQVISAFGDTADAVKVLEINVRAAVAGLSTTEEAIALTSAVTKAYGDTSAEAVQKVADLALQTVKLGQTTFPELASSIGRVTPLAKELGVTQEELFGVMATGTGVTGTASEVGTQLRGVFQSLMNPTQGLTTLLNSMGIESGRALIEQKGLQGAIDIVVAAAKASGEPLQEYIGSIEGQTLALALAGPQAGDFTRKLGEMSNAAGAADAAFDEQTEGINSFGQTLKELGQVGKVILQALGDVFTEVIGGKLMPYMELIKAAVKKFRDSLDEMSPTLKTLVVMIVAAVAAIGPMIAAFGTLLGLIPFIQAGMIALGITMKTVLISSGIGAAVVALGVAAAFVMAHWESIGPFFEDLWSDIKIMTLKAVNAYLGYVAMLTSWIPGLKDLVADARKELSNLIDEEQLNKGLRANQRAFDQMFKDSHISAGKIQEDSAATATAQELASAQAAEAAQAAAKAAAAAWTKMRESAEKDFPKVAKAMRDNIEKEAERIAREMNADPNMKLWAFMHDVEERKKQLGELQERGKTELRTLSDAAEKEAKRLADAYGSATGGGALGSINNALRSVFGQEGASRIFDGFGRAFGDALNGMVDKMVDVIGFGDGIIPQMFARMTTVVLDEIAKMAGEKGFKLLLKGLDSLIGGFGSAKSAGQGAANAISSVGGTAAGATTGAGRLAAALASLGPAAAIAATALAAVHIAGSFAKIEWGKVGDAIKDIVKDLIDVKGLLAGLGPGLGGGGRTTGSEDEGFDTGGQRSGFFQSLAESLNIRGMPDEFQFRMMKEAISSGEAEGLFKSMFNGAPLTPSTMQEFLGIHSSELDDFLKDFVRGFATGGIVMPTPGGTIGRIAEAGIPEVVIPLPELDTLLNSSMGGSQTIIIQLDGRTISEMVVKDFPSLLRMAGVMM